MGPARGLDLDGKGHIAVLDRQPRNHAEADDVLIAVGIDDTFERVENRLFTELGHNQFRSSAVKKRRRRNTACIA